MSKEDLDYEKNTNNNFSKPHLVKKCKCYCMYPFIFFTTILLILTLTFIYYVYPPTEDQTFLSSYIEVLGNGQVVSQNSNIVFDLGSLDSVGNDIVLDSSGTTFTINRTGLYHIEWDVNLSDNSSSAVIGVIENGNAASGSTSSVSGNFSSGTLINVDTVPFTISLYNYANEITLENPIQWEDTATSIRILRFADGPRK